MRSDDDHSNSIHLVNPEFFDPDMFEANVEAEYRRLYQIIQEQEKETAKQELNGFFRLALNHTKVKTQRDHLFLKQFALLGIYAKKFECLETYENLVEFFDTEEIKNGLLCRRTVESRLKMASILLDYFNLKKALNEFTPPIDTWYAPLIEAKAHLFKLYSHHIEGVFVLDQRQLAELHLTLAGCFAQLFRFFEALHHLRCSEQAEPSYPNISYLRARALKLFSDWTCSGYSYQLHLAIVDACVAGKKDPYRHPIQVEQLSRMEQDCRIKIRNSTTSVKELRSHRKVNRKKKENRTGYNDFCGKLDIFLSEHGMYCPCNRSLQDDLKIQTHHPHTSIEWVKEYESLLTNLNSEYITSRKLFFDAQLNSKLENYHLRSALKGMTKFDVKCALIKTAFRNCYSILDSIAILTLNTLGVNYKKALKESGHADAKVNFLNIWEAKYGLITDVHYNEVSYLDSLYSIALDLSKGRSSGLTKFKDIRNAIEHRLLVIHEESESESSWVANKDIVHVKYSEMNQKTELLFILTKSALLTFTYLLRRQSAVKDPNDDEHSE